MPDRLGRRLHRDLDIVPKPGKSIPLIPGLLLERKKPTAYFGTMADRFHEEVFDAFVERGFWVWNPGNDFQHRWGDLNRVG